MPRQPETVKTMITTFVIFSGCVGECRLSDDLEHPQCGDNAEPEDFPVQALVQPVVPSHSEGPTHGQGLVHVPNQHGPHGLQIGISRSSRCSLAYTLSTTGMEIGSLKESKSQENLKFKKNTQGVGQSFGFTSHNDTPHFTKGQKTQK